MSTANTSREVSNSNTDAGAQAAPRPQRGIKAFFGKYGIFLVFLGMCLLLAFLTIDNGQSIFLKFRNIVNVLRQSAVIGIIACGVTFIIVSGGIDLSPGSVVAMTGILAAVLAREAYGLPFIVPVIGAVAVGSLAGAINGTIISKARIPPFIATLGMMTIARGVGFLITNGRPVDHLSEPFLFLGQGSIRGLGENFFIPIPVLIFVSVAVVSHLLLSKTRFGKYTYALGGNEQAAFICGVNVDWQKIRVYTYGGLLTGIAAVVLTSRVSSGQPGAGMMYELDAIASAVIGGTSLQGGVGTIGGTVVGTLIIAVMNNGLDLLGVSSYWQRILKGLIIIGSVVIDTLRQRRRN
jgi:inositol transport system permease protein